MKARVRALQLANDYEGAHAFHSADQVVERAKVYETYLLETENDPVEILPSTIDEGLHGSGDAFVASCDFDRQDDLHINCDDGQICVRIEGVGGDWKEVYLDPDTAKLAIVALNAAIEKAAGCGSA
jgi:hypothetical protein